MPPKRRIIEDFWHEFESECSNDGLISKVPDSMKKILNVCGYNNAWAFKETDNEQISQLESFVETKHRQIADSFEEYRDMRPFQFLPGHRALIMGIKAEILSMEDKKKLKVSKPNQMKNVLDENELKSNLIKQVQSYSSSISIKIDWNQNAITKFQVNTDGDSMLAKCQLSCPKCDTIRVIRYDSKYWKISNMCKHLRSHVDDDESKQNSTEKLSKENIILSEKSKQLREKQQEEPTAQGNETLETVFVDINEADSRATEVYSYETAEEMIIFDDSDLSNDLDSSTYR